MNEVLSQIDNIFNPQSISIIGASSREGSFGRMFLQGLIDMGFPNIYPVHPREEELLGLKAYQNIKDIPHDIDVAILLTPPKDTVNVVKDCAIKGMKGIIVFTAGFGEKDEEGKRAQEEIASIANEHGIRVIGPNSIGVYIPSSKLITFPLALMEGISTEIGPVGVFSHSGSFVDYLTFILTKKGVKFSKGVSCGNECDLNAVDFLEYFGQDKETKILVAYLEGITDGRRFFELAREISKEKPMMIWKGGLTESGAKAALSHTGKLAGSNLIWQAMFKQAGIIPVRSFEEIVNCLYALYFLPLPRGKRIAIVAGMGGTNVATTDNCVELGLEMAKLSKATLDKLTEILPPVGTSVGNPCDVGVATLVAPHLYGESLKVLDQDENVDMLLAISDTSRACLQGIVDASKTIKKPMAVTLFTLPELNTPDYEFLASNDIPVFTDARQAVSILSRVADYANYKNRN